MQLLFTSKKIFNKIFQLRCDTLSEEKIALIETAMKFPKDYTP